MSSAFCALCIVHCALTVSVSPHGEPPRHRRRHRRHARARDRRARPHRRLGDHEHVPVRVAADRLGRAGPGATGGAPPARRCAAALAAAHLTGDDIAAIGFSGQMHGSVLLDDRGEVVRPALLWCDQRTDAQCREITETIGAARLIELTLQPGAHRLHAAEAALGPRARAAGVGARRVRCCCRRTTCATG